MKQSCSGVRDKQRGLRSYMGGMTRMKERQGRSNEEEEAESRKEWMDQRVRSNDEVGAKRRRER